MDEAQRTLFPHLAPGLLRAGIRSRGDILTLVALGTLAEVPGLAAPRAAQVQQAAETLDTATWRLAFPGLSPRLQTTLLAPLRPQARTVLDQRYGLHGQAPTDVPTVAGALGLTRRRVQALELGAVRRLQLLRQAHDRGLPLTPAALADLTAYTPALAAWTAAPPRRGPVRPPGGRPSLAPPRRSTGPRRVQHQLEPLLRAYNTRSGPALDLPALATHLALPPAILRAWAAGTLPATGDTLLDRLCAFFACTPNDLLVPQRLAALPPADAGALPAGPPAPPLWPAPRPGLPPAPVTSAGPIPHYHNFFALLQAHNSATGQAQTLGDVARAVDVSRSALHAWASGHIHKTSDALLAGLCAFFACTPNELLVAVPPGSAPPPQSAHAAGVRWVRHRHGSSGRRPRPVPPDPRPQIHKLAATARAAVATGDAGAAEQALAAITALTAPDAPPSSPILEAPDPADLRADPTPPAPRPAARKAAPHATQ